MSSGPSSSEVPTRQFNPATNPYPAKKTWPPNVLDMDRKYQFRLERRYRRRAQIAYLQPGWVKGVKFAQFSLISAVVAYSVLWMDWGEEFGKPFAWARKLIGIDDSQTMVDVDAAHKRILDASERYPKNDSNIAASKR